MTVPARLAASSQPPGLAPIEPSIPEPRKLRDVRPIYPDLARQARIQGTVTLQCTISPEGRIADVKVLRGIQLLDQAAIDAVRQWVYAPSLINGVPVPVTMTVTVRFRLQ